MSTNIHLRGIDVTTMQILKKEAAQQEISVNSLILSLIKKSLGLSRERENLIFHDLDALAGTWNKNQTKAFMNAIADFEQIDKELWK